MSEKRDFGQYFTSEKVAEFMITWVLGKHPKQVLDPAVGEGIFLKLIHNSSPECKLHACEIDPLMVQRFLKSNPYPVDLFCGDYLFHETKDAPDAIICNPPYLKFQMIPKRKEILNHLHQETGLTLSGYTNACAMFLVKCLHELKDGGRSAFIMPYEFLNTGYGRQIKEYLLKEKALKYILRFDSRVPVFSDALTTSCILLLEKGCCDRVAFYTLSSLEELDRTKAFLDHPWEVPRDDGEPEAFAEYAYHELDCTAKWLSYFTKSQTVHQNLICMKEFVDIKRGIATGCNAYFTLSATQARDFGLRAEVLKPCIVKAHDIKAGIFTQEDYLLLKNSNKKVFLFDGQLSSTKEELDYIKEGVAKGVDQAYLTRHRNPWYALEKVQAAPILFSVFSRNHVKIIRNETNAKHLTAYHGLYLNAQYDTEANANLLYCYLITPLAQEILRESHREYANGLDKFEPGDLQKAKMLNLTLVSAIDRNRIEGIYQEMKQSGQKEEMHTLLIQELDHIFRKYLNEEER